jgi:hypothetical protein
LKSRWKSDNNFKVMVKFKLERKCSDKSCDKKVKFRKTKEKLMSELRKLVVVTTDVEVTGGRDVFRGKRIVGVSCRAFVIKLSSLIDRLYYGVKASGQWTGWFKSTNQ